MNIEIIYEDDTEVAEKESFDKGYRNDVIISIKNKKYKIYIISIIRLQQDFEVEYRDSGYYMSEPNTIIVNEVTKQEIENAVLEMYKCKFFERIDKNGFSEI